MILGRVLKRVKAGQNLSGGNVKDAASVRDTTANFQTVVADPRAAVMPQGFGNADSELKFFGGLVCLRKPEQKDRIDRCE